MQKVIELIQTHTYDFFIPLTALALLRLGLCLAQLKKTASIRKKKGVYHAVRGHYTEIGVWLGVLPACVLFLLPMLFMLLVTLSALVLGIVAAIVLGKAGQKKGTELDGIYREVAWELKHEAEAQAAREAASHTLEGGAAAIENGHADETEHNEDKGETENG